jgi:hypothetical protein
MPPILKQTRTPGVKITANPTATISPNLPMFKEGEVVIDTKGSYLIITAASANGSYSVSKTARNPSGAFIPINSSNITISDIKAFEKTVKSIGYSSMGGTPPGIPGSVPPPVTGVAASQTRPEPLYPPGDLVNSVKIGDAGMIVILGYDKDTDNYKADNLYRYYTGQWGYRLSDEPKWYFRGILERENPYRIGRITLSDIGIGSDSAPPRDKVKYSPGDIISPDIAGTGILEVVLSYNRADDRYEVDTIRASYSGGWYRMNTSSWVKRAFIERDYPYQIRTVDIDQVRKA